jgi:tetratricopeptide (TPR) repeat protein
MVGGIGLVVMLLFAELQSSWDRSGQYLGVARHARAKGDLEAATILYEKALKERQDDAVALFEWMVVSDELGEHSSRDATLGYLVDEVGHLPALLYAGRLALREGKVDEANEILESSLDKIPEKERGPGSVLAAEADDIRRGLMRVRWRGGAFREAIDHLISMQGSGYR